MSIRKKTHLQNKLIMMKLFNKIPMIFNICLTIVSIYHISTLLSRRLYPEVPKTKDYELKLEEIEFPVVFKLRTVLLRIRVSTDSRLEPTLIIRSVESLSSISLQLTQRPILKEDLQETRTTLVVVLVTP